MDKYKFKGTRGPWQIDRQYVSFADTVITQVEDCGEYDEGWRTVIIEGDVSDEADAHLIAAAPDLLEACKEMYKELSLYNNHNSLGGKMGLVAIHKALNIKEND